MAKIVTTIPSSSGVSVHNQLSGLNEGDYLHLTAEEKLSIENIDDLLDDKAPVNNPTFTGAVIVPTATTATQAVNFGQVVPKSGTTDLDPITGDLHSQKGFISEWDEGSMQLGSDIGDYRDLRFDSKGKVGTDFGNVRAIVYANPEECIGLEVRGLDGSFESYQYNLGTQQRSYISVGSVVNETIKTPENTTFSKPIIIPNGVASDEAVNLGQLNASTQNAIPLSGTESGKPITGWLEVAIGKGFIYQDEFSINRITIEDTGIFLYSYDIVNDTYSQMQLNATQLLLLSTRSDFRGLSGDSDYSPNITDLDYTQKIYVDNAVTAGAETTTTILQKIGNGTLIDQQYLPSYVDDVLEFANLAAFPVTGAIGKIYIAIDTSKQYRWTGSVYLQITNGLIASTNDVPDSTNKRYQTDNQRTFNDATSSIQTQLNTISASTHWTKTGDNIRNNNVGDVELKMATGKKVSFLDHTNNEFARFEQGRFWANTIHPGNIMFVGGSSSISTTGGGNRFLKFSNTGLSSDMPFYFDLNDINLQPDNFMTGSIFGVEKFKITRDGKMAIAPATAPNEAVNLSQLANENNVYICKEFVDVNNTEINGSSVSSGTGALNNTNVTANNIGVVRLSSSAGANSGYAWRTFSNQFAIKGGEVFTEIFNPLTFTNTTNRMGIHDSTSSAVPANGVFFRYSGDGLLTLVTADNSIQTTSTTIATLTINTWYKVRFTVNANATSVLAELFNASGTLIASVTQTTNIPTTARRMNLCSIATNSGTTATALIDVDFISAKLTLTR